MLKRIPQRNHINPVLRELHWLEIFLWTHKDVNNTATELLDQCIPNLFSTAIPWPQDIFLAPPSPYINTYVCVANAIFIILVHVKLFGFLKKSV